MDSPFTPLPSVEALGLSLGKKIDLEPIRPVFFVPKLDNRPQNPIIEAINFGNAAPIHPSTSGRPTNCVPTTNAIGNGYEKQAKQALRQEKWQEEEPLLMWLRAARKEDQGPAQNLIKSWDALRPTYPSASSPSGLLSEQDASIFSAVQEFVAPIVRPEGLEPLHISSTDLLTHLMSTLVGNSSPLYSWDSKNQQMVLSDKYHNHVVIASGLTEDMSSSVIHRFIKIGTLLRRLDLVVESFRSARSSPTHHAFAHSLAVVLDCTRKFLAKPQPMRYSFLSQVWLYYTDTEELLSALAGLCFVDIPKTPPYDRFPPTAASLLSHIYGHLSLHVNLSSPQPIRATIAFIFSITSDSFLHSIDRSIGIGKPHLPSTTKKVKLAFDENDYFEEAMDDENNELFEDNEEEEWPEFFPPTLSERLPKAKKSLKVLFAAAPEHPLLTANIARRHCEWVWDEEALERAHKGEWGVVKDVEVNLPPSTPPPDGLLPQPGATLYQPELAGLRIFDLEPGTDFKSSVVLQPTRETRESKTISYQSFLCTFPSTLPPITPTLAQLTETVLSPLGLQCSRLSSALLELFLAPPFSLASHFVLLRDYLLLDSAAFTARLRGALFSEVDAYQPVGHGTRARTRARLGIKEPRDIRFEQEDLDKMRQAAEDDENDGEIPKWGIGLGLGLSERGVWPPGGAELGFALRRVIVDSFADERDVTNADESHDREGTTVRREAEWRLGFAIRDLPVDEGREEWLNPSSIEALDFLYLDYKPPHPLGVLLTPEILSKYHRIFNFLLRLLRVETVSRSLFHSVHQTTPEEALFKSKPQAYRLLLRFRFQTHSFVSTLTSYIFDSAISTHFNAFMHRLDSVVQHIRLLSRQGRDGDESFPSVPDVFELMNDHSKMLDKILGACMLRTQQRAIAEVVTDILSNVLNLGTLVGDMKRGIVDDSTGETRVKKLYHTFERKMFTFVKVLKSLDDKGEIRSLLSSIATNTSDKNYALLAGRMGASKKEGTDLGDLLLRLDLGRWWTHEAVRRAEAKRARMQVPTLASDV